MNAIELFRTQINASHEIVEGTVADLTQELCDHQPEGTAHPIGACYAHLLTTEDFIVNMVLRGKQPLMMGELNSSSRAAYQMKRFRRFPRTRSAWAGWSRSPAIRRRLHTRR